MRARTLIAITALASLLAGVTTADAAAKRKPPPKPVCQLVTDAAADATGTGLAVDGPNDPNLDILSADVATNKTMLTAVFRFTSLSGSGDTAPTGRAYDVSFKVNGQLTSVRSIVGPGGNKWADGLGDGGVYPATKEVRVSVLLSRLSVPIKPGATITELSATSSRWVSGTPVVISVVDKAVGGKPYIAGAPSCVKVGV